MRETPYTPPSGPIRLVFDDEHVRVADKPPGLLSVPGRGVAKRDCLEARLMPGERWLRAVHRLDMDTSGLLVLARTPDAHRRMGAAFAERKVQKTYLAIVSGVPDAAAGIVEAPLMTDWPNRPRQMVDHARGKPALTRWQRLGTVGNATRIRLTPETGRSHQLRVHLASIGHPILGDPLYGRAESQTAAPRLLLHATGLAFDHPITGQRLDLVSPPPF